ncbi:LOW QUALITY PROTEIN: probable glycosyltransferase At3g07620 [Pyrus x bretschneideri]|uniref:LOW QUALITY PROTEIN: probable glycosyltransferase At3g07620 n=1 Tax=Pyrus x bretschneideri TaxID=225117 RepID=UPI002030DED2|nr:LOW QUALITY PROTEIN: probable glycosyltransferase At3g07620 [Pyrus x bretschneideri]
MTVVSSIFKSDYLGLEESGPGLLEDTSIASFKRSGYIFYSSIALPQRENAVNQRKRKMKQVYRRYQNSIVFAMASVAIVYMVVSLVTNGSKGTSWFNFSPSQFPWLGTGVDMISGSTFRINYSSSYKDATRMKGDENLKKLEAGLAAARALIGEAIKNPNHTTPLKDADYIPKGDNLVLVMIVEYLFHPIIRDKAVLERTVVDYVRIISNRYPYWNRSLGADHVMLSCHDWGPRATWYVKQLYFVAIRVLCNANTSEHFNPKKDASFPEINLETGEITGLIGGLHPSKRTILAFFAGRMHGRIRPFLFEHWKGKDRDLLVYEKLPEELSYHDMLKKSKYCICPSGHEVASPRIVEAIYAECVPVLISQHYVLPFSDVLNWDSFSVQVSVSEIPKLKEILMEIPEEQYRRMQERVKQVQRHFVVNNPPKRFDVFHMIIHSIWLRRLNVQI